MSALFESELFLTTPLYYTNASPHLGHGYATILADVIARYARQKGVKVLFCTGTDEHGEKIAAAAAKYNVSPKTFVDGVSEEFRQAWQAIGIHYDIFYRTTQPAHYELVQQALQQLKDRDEVYFATYEGKYCVGCERFRTDQEWNEQGLCPDHLTPPQVRKESNYFFRMEKYRERLLKHYEQHPDTIQPESYRNEVLGYLRDNIGDLSISRPVERLTWGIPFPFDPKHVTYVWFDALLNYVGALGYDGKDGVTQKFQQNYWAHSNHIIGKDILKTHSVYWPTMLMALGLPVFQRLQVSGYWLMDGMKMSKSLGNVRNPVDIGQRFGHDTLRYFLLREMSYGKDSSFTWESFILRSNAELANGLGNLTSRSLTLAHKYLGAKVPPAANLQPEDKALLEQARALPAEMAKEMEACRYHTALKHFADVMAACDRYINDMKPWALGKESAENPAQLKRLEAVLNTAMNCLWTFSVVMDPVLPEGCAKLRAALGQNAETPKWSEATRELKAGTALGEVPRLYPRLELPKEQ